MIKVEGYRAFHGTMRINYGKNSTIAPEEITADWLYKPAYKCWYGQCRSFPAEICEVVRDDAEIVRCGECKHRNTEDCPMSEIVDENYTWVTDKNAEYCSYGKAKEGDGE